MDIEEFTKKYVIKELKEMCEDTPCSKCPFHCISEKSSYTCKLIQLDENLVRDRETPIWSRRT